MGKPSTAGLDPHQAEIAKLIRHNATRNHPFAVFRDFCELGAISFSNVVDRQHYADREDRYLKIVGKYERAEVERFPAMVALLAESLEGGFKDSLGQLFMALELGDQGKGQFFTPYHVSSMMAQMLAGDTRAQVESDGFISVCEPTVGAGGMVIAFAEAMQLQDVNYQQHMHVTAVDIDVTAVHMAYLQFALLHIPAIVLHGNSLSLEVWDHWVTPAHVLGLWDLRLRTRDGIAKEREDAVPPSPARPPVETIEVEEHMPAAADVIADARKAVVQERLRQFEQLALFA